MARRLFPSWAITMIVARSSAVSCSKCLLITTPINVEVLHLILDSSRNDSLIFRIFEKPILSRICNNYLRRVDFLYTVSSGLSNLYRRDYEVCMRVVHSTPSLNPLIYPHPAHFPFRLVHHGVANRNRSLEQLIYIARALPEMVVLSFFLTGDQNEIKRLKTIADEMPNVEFCSPVPMTDIVQTMNNYDLGLVYWPPTTENLINSAPNKFFEYLHAGVAVVCAPLPSIAPIVDEYDCGIMAESFDRDSVVSLIKNLSAADITRMKYNARKAAEKYSFENESIVFEEFLKRTASYKKSNSE
jgi:glycosyltransferase involved in cell wall biosynthesis